MPLPDGLSKLFKRGVTLDLPDHREPVLRRVADLGLVTVEEYRYVKCVNPLDPDQKYVSQASCTGRIRLHADWDEDDWAYRCPSCDRQIFPGKKISYSAVSVSPSPDGMRAYVRQQLDTLGVEVEEKPEGLFRLAGRLGEAHVCLVDCCPDRSLLRPDYYNDKTAYVVGNERGHLRILRKLERPVFGLAGMVVGDSLDTFLAAAREMAALDGRGPVRPAVLTLDDLDAELPQDKRRMATPEESAVCELIDREGRRSLTDEAYRKVVGAAASYDLFIDLTRTVRAGRYSAGRKGLDGRFEAVQLKPNYAAIWIEYVEVGRAMRPGELRSVSSEGADKLVEQARRALDVNLSRYEWRALHTLRGDTPAAKQYYFNPPASFKIALLVPPGWHPTPDSGSGSRDGRG